ncbi:SAM-dependent methyltransferase [Streptomyces aidingensis]|uniref:Methyltransferase domain-containing protein n=1 Tax=Streptomyces aidingensis TaxID=910347 RepID=A0A1I1TUK1_9ACTN|nr:class I SAM-dependent methyltransferase [Streptomyces aidingensis]SFD62065.1 Methyltransferase domain-containing protein [Streptomyces aidingensis]
MGTGTAGHGGRREVWNPARGGAAPSSELAELARAHPFSSVLDAGCGWGRNLVPFATAGATVLHGFDTDREGVRATRELLAPLAREADVRIWNGDLRATDPGRSTGYDLVICYGVTHFLDRAARLAVYRSLTSWVRPDGGMLALASFNAAVPIPGDLRPLMPDPPPDSGEVREHFADGWETVRARSYIYDDEHENGVRHTHSIDRLIVRRTTAAPRR